MSVATAAAILAFSDVTRRFGGVLALNGVSFAVRQGAIVGLIGPNGAGKTTAFNVATGAFPVTSGMIRFEDEPIHNQPPHRIAQRGIARTFQNIRLFHSMTVWEHILVGTSANGGRNAWLRMRAVRAQRVRAGEILELMGLGSVRHRIAATLPYGLQRRVEIARALASRPRLLLLDEPVAGMNADEAAELRELVLRLRSETRLTILLIEHDMPFVMDLCDHLFVLDFGAVIAEGEPGQIQADPLVIEAYLGSPAEAAIGRA